MNESGLTERKRSAGGLGPDVPPDAEPSSLRQGWGEAGSGVFNVVAFFETWKAISEKPERMVEQPVETLKVSPLTFAVQGALLLYLISSSVGGFADTFLDIEFEDRPMYARRMSELDAAVAAARTPEARAGARRALRDYRWEVKGAEIAENAVKAATAPAYLAGACVFEWFLRRLRGRYGRVAHAYGAFLYEITRRGFLPSALLLGAASILMIWGETAPAGETAAVASQGGAESMTIVALVGYVVGTVWLLLSYVGMGRSLCRLFGLPSHSRQRPLTREENAARHRIVNGFVLGIAVMATLTYVVAFGTSWFYILLRHLFGGGVG